MAIDTQGLASIGEMGGFDPVGAQAKALSIKDMMDRQQLSKLQVGQAKSDSATNTKVQELLKGEGVDYSNPEGVMRTAEKLNKISPKAALEFQTQAQKYSSGKVQAQVDQYELLDHQQGLIVSAIDPIVAQAREMKNKGTDDMTVNAFIAQQLPGALSQLQNTKLPNGQSALSPEVIKQVQEATKNGPIGLSTLEGFETKSKQGQAQIRARLEQMKADTTVKKEEEGERHNREMERQGGQRVGQGQERIDITRQKAEEAHKTFGGENGDLAAELAIRGVSLPAGFRSKSQQVELLEGLRRNNKDLSLPELAEKIASGQLSFANAKVEGRAAAGVAGKVTYAEHEIEQTIPLLREASANLPRGQFVPWNKLQQMGQAADSDPKLKEFKAYMTSLSNAYDMLSARGGTDAEKRAHNRELFNTADSPEALEGVLKAVQNEAQASGRAADESMRDAANRNRSTKDPGATPAAGGAGGAPTQVLRFDSKGNPI
jgi:hypothetical protein